MSVFNFIPPTLIERAIKAFIRRQNAAALRDVVEAYSHRPNTILISTVDQAVKDLKDDR